ncbi:hypothetical protein Ancab_013528 [Ancistrocladus abbreviatus]
MEHSACLPYDIALRIASSLPVRDVCSLGSCSKFWREVCGSDPIWVSLSKQRWPSLHLTEHSQGHGSDLFSKGWKGFFVERHGLMASIATDVVNFVQLRSSFISLELRDYRNAIEMFITPDFELKDVELFLFKPESNVLINFAGLFYCISYLRVPFDRVMEALESCNISERQVFVRWSKLVGRPHTCILEVESCSCWIALGDLVSGKEEEVLQVLRQEPLFQPLVQVKICAAELDEA